MLTGLCRTLYAIECRNCRCQVVRSRIERKPSAMCGSCKRRSVAERLPCKSHGEYVWSNWSERNRSVPEGTMTCRRHCFHGWFLMMNKTPLALSLVHTRLDGATALSKENRTTKAGFQYTAEHVPCRDCPFHTFLIASRQLQSPEGGQRFRAAWRVHVPTQQQSARRARICMGGGRCCHYCTRTGGHDTSRLTTFDNGG
ncbi:hypothetical protein K437DRAFT_4466 [Tilletiaria anomala UBC 951]|uniref:Uncharacterized protein n=1 Tax=Tilletiaria anomala (strain ATCC 24038 / CBS 436.72 / UBC 951) TaxID=1037660 RepID=A0A066WI04_TILAU|nr:uncharacterized protein K437DRAFT_4466 [Tilletiaria anomala UBC 951]KDN53647.1 hypothetical protein K437DRAFT_4466 [Tilletiaria anomala UBC 951]